MKNILSNNDSENNYTNLILNIKRKSKWHLVQLEKLVHKKLILLIDNISTKMTIRGSYKYVSVSVDYFRIKTSI